MCKVKDRAVVAGSETKGTRAMKKKERRKVKQSLARTITSFEKDVLLAKAIIAGAINTAVMIDDMKDITVQESLILDRMIGVEVLSAEC